MLNFRKKRSYGLLFNCISIHKEKFKASTHANYVYSISFQEIEIDYPFENEEWENKGTLFCPVEHI